MMQITTFILLMTLPIPWGESFTVSLRRRSRMLATNINMQTSEDRDVKKPNTVPKIKIVIPDGEDETDREEADFHDLPTPSIENEVLLKKFINEINKKDRGIDIEEEEDFGETLDLLIDKTFDTFEDIGVMYNRMMKEKEIIYGPDTLEEWNETSSCKEGKYKPRVLVVGSGWASHAFIKCLNTEKYRSLVVSPTNYFVFTPMLASTSVGTTETRSIIEATRDSNPFSRFLEGRVLDFDLERKTARVRLGEGDIMDDSDDSGELIDIPYDICVYAAGVGPISSSLRTPGLSKENVCFLKTVNDAKRLKKRVIDLLEQASQPGLSDEERRKMLTFVVVGGGPTGVEYCGELCDFLEDVTSKGRRGINKGVGPFANLENLTSIKLIQGNEDLLPMFDKNLRESAKTGLMEKGVDVMTSTSVSRIEGTDQIILSSESGETKVDCGIIVWAAGTKQLKITESVINNLDEYAIKQGFETKPSQLSVRGRIPVDKWLRVISTPPGSMMAMGDAACPIDSKDLPQTAQVAAQQGAYIARLLNREYDLTGDGSFDKADLCVGPPINRDAEAGNTLTLQKLRGRVKAKPFKFLNLGQLAYTGGGQALSQVQLGNKKIFNQAGSVGFLLWRSVYIVKQVSTKTRLLVLFDWFKTKIFGRDVTRM